MYLFQCGRRPAGLFRVLVLAAMFSCVIGGTTGGVFGASQNAQSESTPGSNLSLTLAPDKPGIWDADIGGGFRKGTDEIGFTLGDGFGIRRLAKSTQAHDLALASVNFGKVLTGVWGRDHWYEGNLELLGEIFWGAQYSPRPAYLAGGKFAFRYDFATGTRWVPFVEAGAGCLATDIHQPDLSTTFQFTEQGGPGVQYFWRKNAAVTFEIEYIHISNAGIQEPNQGANTIMLCLGMSWFF